MSVGGAFLGSAKGRLLPAWAPFRFFATAAVLHVALWAALILAAGEFTEFSGGVGPSLAAVHILTVGTLIMTAIGAATQLLPVATARPLAAVWPVKAIYWLLTPGAIALVAGMYAVHVGLIIGGAALCATGLALFSGLLADNLSHARSMPVVRAYGWTALVSLVLLVALGLSLSLDLEFGFLVDHTALASVHMILGAFGFMGMLALGFSHVLIPMFALSNPPNSHMAKLGFALATAALGVAIAGALLGRESVLSIACVLGLVSAGLHLRLMQVTLETGMRKRLGLSFLLVRVSWVMFALTPLVGLGVVQGWFGPAGPTLFGLVSLGGWLMTFMFGVFQRIAPFLASMHGTRATRRRPLLSEFGASRALTVHTWCHLAAMAGLALAAALHSATIVRLAATVGLVGALAFATFMAGILHSLTLSKSA